MLQKSTPSLSNKFFQILLAVLALFVGLYPLFYFFQDKFGLLGSKNSSVLTSTLWTMAFYTHIISGGLALMIGWIQFSQKIRIAALAAHRNLGRLYLIFALFSSASAAYLAVYADGGLIAKMGFLCLGIVWFASTCMGYTSILKGQVAQHRKFMMFSYAACFAAVTLRLLLPLLIIIVGDFTTAYILVAWLCWLPNMLVAYLITQNPRFVA